MSTLASVQARGPAPPMHSQPFVANKIRRWLPYWLGGGDRTCSDCGFTHAYAVEARCIECDRPHCPVCVVHVEGGVVCSDCHGKKGTRKRKWRPGRSGKA